MNNYKELSFLISSLFVIYFFKDIITTLIILVILSSISALIIKTDMDNDNTLPKTENNNYNQNIKPTLENPVYSKPNYTETSSVYKKPMPPKTIKK
jgi:hypothetical protein